MKYLLLVFLICGCSQVRIKACRDTVNHLSDIYDKESDSQFCDDLFK